MLIVNSSEITTSNILKDSFVNSVLKRRNCSLFGDAINFVSQHLSFPDVKFTIEELSSSQQDFFSTTSLQAEQLSNETLFIIWQKCNVKGNPTFASVNRVIKSDM